MSHTDLTESHSVATRVDGPQSTSMDRLSELADYAVEQARSRGASAAAQLSVSQNLTVSVRQQALETAEHSQSRQLDVSVFLGKNKSGHASTTDLSRKAIEETVQAACQIAQFSAEDPCSGLPEAEELAFNPVNLDLFYPWSLSLEEAQNFARLTESAAFAVDAQIRNSEGAQISTHQGHFILANTLGFHHGYGFSSHHIQCSVIAGQNDAMQRDDWFLSQRLPFSLAAAESVGREAARRALARLGGRGLSTRTAPVLFAAPVALGLIGSLARALSGGGLYRKTSFLLDSLGKKILPDHIQLEDDPHILQALGSTPFDSEGVRTRRRLVIEDGVVQGYFLSSYSARKLGLKTTGNAGGSHNLGLSSKNTQPTDDFNSMLKKMGTGLVVTELMGQGINYVTGDYSRGAAGFWVQDGQIQYPVEGITIAGSLPQMLLQIEAIGADTLVRGSKKTGSILIEQMTIAGNG